jgi:acyl carrier protein
VLSSKTASIELHPRRRGEIMDMLRVVDRLGVFQDGVLLANASDVLGALDSLDLVELTHFIEGSFGIRVDLEDVTAANFTSLGAIGNMVSQKLGSVEV